MQVIAYQDCVPPKNKNPQKSQILPTVITGVRTTGDQADLVHGSQLRRCDVAVIQGWVHERSSKSRHLELRRNIIQYQKANGNRTLIADSNLFLYMDPRNPHNYLRYSFDDVFPNDGEYFDSRVDPCRWQDIARDHGIILKPWRKKGSHILICCQRNGGWSMGKTSVVTWLAKVIIKIRQHSDRPIVVRPHPGDKDAPSYIGEFHQAGELANVGISAAGSSLVDDLKHCWAVVNHNSSPAVGAAIEGVPVFVTDPVRSQCREIAATDLALIEAPIMPDRQQWLYKIAMSHWSFADWETGRAWAHIRQFV